MSDTLVVYFSRKGRAQRVAEELAKEKNADLLRLETTEPTRGKLGFWWCGRFAMHRWEMPLKPYDTDVSAYEHVVLVSPVWVFSACSPAYAFARAESGHMKSVEYAFVHFSPFMRYKGTAAALDRLIGATNEGYLSVACAWGFNYLRKRFPALSKS